MSGAVQSGQRAAVEVLAELCPAVLTQEELGASLQLGGGAGAAPKPTQQPRHGSLLPTGRALILAALAIGGAVALAKRPDAMRQAKSYLTHLLPALGSVL